MAQEHALPLGMLAARLAKEFENDVFEQLTLAGYPELRVRHSVLLSALDGTALRLGQLAAQAGMTPQAMGELVDDLEAGGYLARHNDPADRRARLIVATPRGERALAECLRIVATIEASYATALGADRLDDVKQAITELLRP
ncbi:MarR family winged helix-turn-helix transcriptional regulator [Agromyces sp. NPDC058136]|uniref:MarR family winged helix-turn-helix transcriptional regulator n=1 Tax=Agromyces sp. NPDC058136 TaxID=3346354 RepID=UPI0036D7A673